MNVARETTATGRPAPFLFAGFNQDASCFSIGFETGFSVYNVEPLREKKRRDFTLGETGAPPVAVPVEGDVAASRSSPTTSAGGDGGSNGSGIGIVTMLHRCQYLALVGGGRNPRYPTNKVMIWDDTKARAIIELEFRTEVRNVLLSRQHIVTVCANKVFVHTFATQPELLHVFETAGDDQRGLAALSTGIVVQHQTNDQQQKMKPAASILAIPGRQHGHLQIVDLDSYVAFKATSTNPSHPSNAATQPHDGKSKRRGSRDSPSGSDGIPEDDDIDIDGAESATGAFSNIVLDDDIDELDVDDVDDASSATRRGRSHSTASGSRDSKTAAATTTASAARHTLVSSNINIIAAHATRLSCLAVSPDGSRVASASEKGTLVRVFDTSTCQLLHELRRGVDRADIFSIAFNIDATRLCVASDKGTIHLFRLPSQQQLQQRQQSDGDSTVTVAQHHQLQSPQQQPQQQQQPSKPKGNKLSSLSFFKDLLPRYFSSEWSFAQFRLHSEMRCICAFAPDDPHNSILIVCADGTAIKIAVGQGASRDEVVRLWYRRIPRISR
ncbi:WD40 repeat-like protein [Ramicandelaber brevisporus]|nr:WD40 repeat-like protein [Ramicandelaber brevisporus]